MTIVYQTDFRNKEAWCCFSQNFEELTSLVKCRQRIVVFKGFPGPPGHMGPVGQRGEKVWFRISLYKCRVWKQTFAP